MIMGHNFACFDCIMCILIGGQYEFSTSEANQESVFKMKGFRLFPLVLYAVLCLFTPAFADEIKDFNSAIAINTDASIDVTETINIDFGTAMRHGFYRIIPVQYVRRNVSYTLPLTVKKVTNDSDVEENYTFTHQGHDVMIKIGDADRTISGVHIYKIFYHVNRAINFFKEGPELYWNATGDQWPYIIEHASAVVRAPLSVPSNQIRVTSYFGPPGSTEDASSNVRGSAAFFSTPAPLNPGDGLTIVIGLPPGSVIQPTWLKEAFLSLVDWWPAYVAPLVAFAIMYLLWWHSGRDVDANHPIAVEWNPPKNLSPAEVGTLVDESCDLEDIISTLIDLAARGHLKITQHLEKKFLSTSKDYTFTKTEPPSGETLLPHETEFLKGIFNYDLTVNSTTSLSDLKERFYVHLPVIKELIYNSLTTKGLFLSNPEQIREQYVAIAITLLLSGVWLFIYNRPFGIGTIISAGIVACFIRAMPALSAAGSKAKRECLGFARFVRLAEKERIKVLAKEDPTIFGRLLPYAMVLGAADQWASAFEGLLTTPPDWYQSSGYSTNTIFSASDFVNDLGMGMNYMRGTFVSAPTSSSGSSGSGSMASSGDSGFSGGFSGGGFGGGGGGSW
jgi:uncharacterized membrane protein